MHQTERCEPTTANKKSSHKEPIAQRKAIGVSLPAKMRKVKKQEIYRSGDKVRIAQTESYSSIMIKEEEEVKIWKGISLASFICSKFTQRSHTGQYGKS